MQKSMKIMKKLDERMKKKSKKQIIVLGLISNVLLMLMLPILSAIKGEIIVLITIVYFLIVALVEWNFVVYWELADQKERWNNNEQRKKERFEKGSIKVLPSKLSEQVYIELVDWLEVLENKRFLKSFNDYENAECKAIIEPIIRRQEMCFTAALIEDKICIFIDYKGKKYQPNRLKSTNFLWFEVNFFVIE